MEDDTSELQISSGEKTKAGQLRGTIKELGTKVVRMGEEYLEALGFVTRGYNLADLNPNKRRYAHIDILNGAPEAVLYTMEKKRTGFFHHEQRPNIEETRNIFDGKKILNIGSGARGLEEYMQRNRIKAKVISLDPSYDNLPDFYQALSEKPHISYRNRSLSTKEEENRIKRLTKKQMQKSLSGRSVAAQGENLPFRDESFDYVLAFKSLPLWANEPGQIREFFSEAFRVLKPGGELRVNPFVWDARRLPVLQSRYITLPEMDIWPELQRELTTMFDIFFMTSLRPDNTQYNTKYPDARDLVILKKKAP